MALSALRSLIHRRGSMAWLLALVLWLPVAQWAAASHALLHLPGAAADRGDAPAHPPAPCDTCIVAAALGAAAPQSPAAIALLPGLHQAHPQAPQPADALLPVAAPYRSRAPPSLHA